MGTDDEQKLAMFERELIMKVCGPTHDENNRYRRRMNHDVDKTGDVDQIHQVSKFKMG